LVGPTQNIYRTVVRHPELAEKMTTLGRALRAGDLSLRERETIILRAGWRCQSDYEFAQHRRVALGGGMTEADIDRIIAGPTAGGWDEAERLLCTVVDQLHDSGTVDDATYAALAASYDEQQLIGIVMLAGYYHLVSFVLNVFQVPVEDGAIGFKGR
jgi:4-carboxymuconolactone decarboxylase